MRRALALVLVACAAVLPGVAQASSPHALAALHRVQSLQRGNGVKTGFELSPALHELTRSLRSLTGSDRLQAEAILARPDDTQVDPPDTHKWDPKATQAAPVCTAHFCVHYVVNTADASTKAYATQMADILENQVYPCENGTGPTACAGNPGLGWREPASDGTLGGDGRVDVYIEDLYTNEHVFGYVAVDPGQSQDPAVPHYAYMVLDNDYTRFGGDHSAAYGLGAEQVTAAHEYNHVLQNAYDYLEDEWMFESTAVYMEEKVYPSGNDYLNYVTDWAANPAQPLTLFSKDNDKPYGSAVWNHWLDHRFGTSAVRAAWEQSTGASDFAPAAYNAAIAAAGGGDFQTEFDRFSAAVAEWGVPAAGFPDTYPDVVRSGTLPVGNQTTPFDLAHTTFALFDVPIPADAPPRIRLVGTLPLGTAGAVALVGRTGADPTAGDVTTELTPMPAGGTAAVELENPAQFGRITAVMVNSDPSKSGFDSTADDYIFTKDASGVVAAMAEPGPPIPTSGAATQVTDHTALIGGVVDPHMLDTKWQIEYGRTIGYGRMTKPVTLGAAAVGAPSVSSRLTGLKARATYHYRVFATNSAGVTAGRDVTFRTLRDVTKPKVVVRVKRQRFARVREGGLVYRARCSERCAGSVELVLGRGQAARLGLPVVLAKTRLRLPARPRLTTLHLRLSQRARSQISAGTRTLTAFLRVRVADEAHNAVVVRRRVHVV